MELNNIEVLLEKYENGETSTKEEAQLRAYFTQSEIAPHLAPYKAMFQYFASTKQEQFTKEVTLQPRRSYIYQLISVAAVLLIMFGIYYQFENSKPTTLAELNGEELAAYNHTKQALDLVSSKFNEGSSSFNVLGIAASQFEKGAEQVTKIEKFSKTTDKIFKKQ